MSFLEEYQDYCSEFTDSPTVFHHRIGYSILSTVLGRKIYFWQGHRKIFPNLWLIIIAPSSFYRKSYSLGIAENILRQVQAKTDEKYILPREFSHERFVEILADQPRGLLVAYEFKTFMSMMSRDYMVGTQSMITELFDCPEVYDRKTKVGEHEIHEPFINILAATTIDWMKASVRDTDLTSGFLPRFLVVPFTGRKENPMAWQPEHSVEKMDKLVSKLVSFSRLAGPCTIYADAKNYYAEWYKKFEHEWSKPSVLSPFYARIQEYTKKLAILTCVDQTGTILVTKDHMETACRLADTYTRWITGIIEEDFTFTDKNQKKVLEAIKSAGDDGITRSELIAKTRLIARTMNPIIDMFVESRQVRRSVDITKTSHGASRETITYFWKNGSQKDDD